MDPGTLQDPAPQVMVFIPHTRVFTIVRQSLTVRGMTILINTKELAEADGTGDDPFFTPSPLGVELVGGASILGLTPASLDG